jgi:tryptophan synthase alpha chain
MSRIRRCFQALAKARRTALIPYVTAGDPNPEVTVPLLRAMVDAGADILEVGVPFSDPMADGPVIQAACERALAHHTSLRHVLEMVREFRSHNSTTPVVLMGYLNPIEVMGYTVFAEAAGRTGVDGVLTVDLPPEEGSGLVAALRQVEIDPIFLLSPTSSDERVRRIAELASGFLYYVSFKGVTGSNRLDVAAVATKLERIRAITALPLGVGFGIRDAESAAQIAEMADAVVVGSALVKRIEALAEKPDEINASVCSLIADMRQAMNKRQFRVTGSD